MHSAILAPDRSKAKSFLHVLAPGTDHFTFQSFTDSAVVREALRAKQERDPLARVLHGSLAQHWGALSALSAIGAGIFVVINETDSRGRAAANILGVRAFFADLDGAPLGNLSRLGVGPQLCTQTSPGRYHAFYRVEGATLDQFKPTQQRLARLMQSDLNVCDLPRVMRLPGFPNLKEPSQPFMVQLATPASPPIYPVREFQVALASAEAKHIASHETLRPSVTDAAMSGLSSQPPDMALGYPDGHRTRELTKRAGWCLGPQQMSEAQAYEACVNWNRYNKPPLPEEKLRSTVASIARAEAKKQEMAVQSTNSVSFASQTIEDEPQSTFRRLAPLSPVEYDRARMKEAERLGIRLGTLDDEVDKFRPEKDEELRAGRVLALPMPKAWSESVDGSALLIELASEINRFVVLPWEGAIALALWIVHSYVFDAFSISPRLAITSPEKQCGKTTLLSLIEALVPKPLLASNITTAATFRAIEEWKPTLLIDEADTFLQDYNELRGVLNSGHRRNGQVVRTVGDKHDLGVFSTFCPTAIASIGKLPSTLEDRSVVISMRRALPDERFSRFDQMAADALAPLASKAKRWSDDHLKTLRDSDPELPTGLHGRAADNWRPLLAIADLIGGDWGRWARLAALNLNLSGAEGDGSVRTQLLTDIRALLDERKIDRISSADITQALCTIEGRPWQDWKAGRPITPNQLARLLAPFGIKPKTMRVTKEPVKGYERSDFNDAFKRYLPPLVPVQP